MKRFLFPALFLTIIGLLFSCKSSNENGNIPTNAIDPQVVENPASASPGGTNSRKTPAFTFDSEEHDFGTVTAGEKVSFAYHFKNTGDADLVIRSANGSCGCTVPEFPKEAIKPGGDGIINVTFNSEGKEGQQLKTITLISNAIPTNYVITIKANVVPAK